MTGLAVCGSCRFPVTHCQCGPGLMPAPSQDLVSMRQLRDLLLRCLGEAPRHLDSRFANPLQQGRSNSGTAVTINSGSPQTILDLTDGQMVKQGENGLAQIHVSVSVGAPNVSEVTPNNVLILNVIWQSGNAGGMTVVDATKGGMIVIGGDNVVRVEAFMQAVDDEVLTIYAPVTVQANVHWQGSVNPKGAMYAPPFVDIVAATASDWIAIPNQAYSMIALSPTPEVFDDLLCEFSTDDDASGASIKYATLNPNANGSPIVQGVNFLRFTHPTEDMTVCPVFEYSI